MNLRVWLIISDPERERRWRGVLERLGWPVSRADLATLRAEAAAARLGLLLLDCAEFGPRAAAAIKDLKSQAPSVSLLIVSPEPLPVEFQVRAIEAGADDCLAESLDDRLILAKLNAHLRRALPLLSESMETLMGPGGNIKVDRRSREVLVRGGSRGAWTPLSSLTPTETRLLSLFLERPGTVLDRAFLLKAVWGGKAENVFPASVDKHIESLRRKMGSAGARIMSVYGAGYILKGDKP